MAQQIRRTPPPLEELADLGYIACYFGEHEEDPVPGILLGMNGARGGWVVYAEAGEGDTSVTQRWAAADRIERCGD